MYYILYYTLYVQRREEWDGGRQRQRPQVNVFMWVTAYFCGLLLFHTTCVEVLAPSVAIHGAKSLIKLFQRSETLVQWDWQPYKRKAQLTLCLCLPLPFLPSLPPSFSLPLPKYTEKTTWSVRWAHCKPGRQRSPKPNNYAGTVTSDIPPPQLQIMNFSYFFDSVCSLSLWQPKQPKTSMNICNRPQGNAFILGIFVYLYVWLPWGQQGTRCSSLPAQHLAHGT